MAAQPRPNEVLYVAHPSTEGDGVEAALAAAGFEVAAFDGDGAAGDFLAEHEVDCVVVACEEPDERGIQLARELREQAPETPIVLCRDEHDESTLAEAFDAGVTDCVRRRLTDTEHTVLVNRVSSLIERQAARRRVEQRNREHEALADLGRLALESDDLGAVFDRAVECVASALDAPFAKVLRLDPTADHLELVAGVGWEPGVVGQATVGTGPDSQAGHTIRTAEPVVVEDLRTEERFSGPALLVDHGVVSGVSVVIGPVEEPWGVLGVHTTEERGFSAEETNFVENASNLLATAIDRQRAAEALGKSEARFKEIAELSPDPIWRLDQDGRFSFVSPAVVGLLGYEPDELLGEHFGEYVSESSMETAFDGFNRVLSGDTDRGMEVGLLAADGSTVETEISARPITEDGAVVGVQGISRDVSRRKARRRELERTQRAMDAAPIGISIADATQADQPLIWVNRGFTALTGYDEAEVLGENCRFLQGEGTDPAAAEAMARAIERAEDVELELLNYRKDGTPFWNRVTIAPVSDEAGEVTHFVGFQQDVTDRVEQAAALERHVALFEQVQEMAEIGGWEYDATVGEAWRTDEVKRIFGREPDAPVLAPDEAMRYYHPEDRPTIEAAFDRAVAAGEPYDLELRVTAEDGEEKWVRTIGEPQVVDGELRRIRGTIQDITARRKRRDELAETNELLWTLLDELPAGVLAEDEDRRVEAVNPRLLELFGVMQSPEEVRGADCAAVAADVSPLFADPAGFLEGIEQRLEAGESVVREPLELADGRTFERSYHPLELPDGPGHLWVYWDVTEREAQLRALRRFEEAVELTGSAVFILDADWRFEYVNPAFEEMTGYEFEDLLDETSEVLGSGDHDRAFMEEVWETVESGAVWEGVLRDRRKSGEVYTAVTSIAPITAEGETTGYVCTQTDVSDRLMDEERLRVLNRILRHNLRNDLNVAQGYIQDTLERLEGPGNIQDLETALASIKGLLEETEKARTLQHLLDQTHRRRTSIESLHDRLVAETGVRPTVADPAAAPEATATVLEILGRALIELVDNAFEHGGDPAGVEVTVRRVDENRVAWTVADAGPGLPVMEGRVLDTGVETPLVHSQGVGLWTAHWLVEIAGGTIRVEDNEPRGTRITVEVPLVD